MERLTLKSLETAVAALPRIQGMLLEKSVLLSAFNLVENRKDPRGPISATVGLEVCEVEPEVIGRAITFFTATVPTITRNKDESITFRSEGYRAGPAGDH